MPDHSSLFAPEATNSSALAASMCPNVVKVTKYGHFDKALGSARLPLGGRMACDAVRRRVRGSTGRFGLTRAPCQTARIYLSAIWPHVLRPGRALFLETAGRTSCGVGYFGSNARSRRAANRAKRRAVAAEDRENMTYAASLLNASIAVPKWPILEGARERS